MAIIQDGLGALITYLRAQSDISTLLGNRVYGLELLALDADEMPRKAIVLNHAGGVGENSYADIFKLRIDFFCYGETPYEAQETWRTLRPILRDMERNTAASTVLYNAQHSAGPVYLRSQDTEWPLIIDTWLIAMQETVV